MALKRTKPSNGADKSGIARIRLGAQTLQRGLDVVEVVAEGEIALTALSERLKLTRSTTHRLATALVERQYLRFAPRNGYSLGPKLIELGYRVRDKLDVAKLAAPHLEKLAKATADTAQLAIRDGNQVLCLDIVPGNRRVPIRARIGEAQPLIGALGKALLLDAGGDVWQNVFAGAKDGTKTMRQYAALGYALDVGQSEEGIFSIAAPVRGDNGKIVAAISLSSAMASIDDARKQKSIKDILSAAQRIGRDLGCPPEAPPKKAVPAKRKTAARKKS